MDRKYQIFISSTYSDLQQERHRVTQTVMELDHIPIGMEAFPAVDEDQWDFIKKLIDETDYYIVIVGGRYGSTASDGLSYTEKEYDYAVEQGVPVLALLHEHPERLSMERSETTQESRDKLEVFRKKLMHGRLVKFWSEPHELAAAVATSLPKQIKVYARTGWVRADTVAQEEVLKENFKLRQENERLREENKGLRETEDFDELLRKEIELRGEGLNHSSTLTWSFSIRDILQQLGA